MMEILEAIFTRRSIRKYTGEAVSDKDIDTIIRAGFSAPSAHNLQPWHFVIVRNRDKLNAFADYATYQKMLYEADCAIIICGDAKKQSHQNLLVNDCSAATENMLLAAHGLGLGAVWCGLAQISLVRFFSKELELPENILPMALISLGHPAEERPASKRYNAKHVHHETFGNPF